ncbi:MAG: CHASE2 domain-containing protein [Syntrophomonadales bacterium]
MLKWKSLFLPAGILLLFLLSTSLGLWERVENTVYDGWFRISGEKDPGNQIVLIGIGEESIRELGQLPWPRSVFAEGLELLGEAQVVAFDLILDLPSEPSEDQALAEAVARHGGVVLACGFTFDEDDGQIMQEIRMPLDHFLESCAGVGFINTPTDRDNVVRHSLVAYPAGEDFFIPSFSLAIAQTVLGPGADRITRLSDGKLLVGDTLIPVDQRCQALSNFWGPGGAFPSYEYLDVLQGKVNPEVFRDRIVLIGPTSVLMRDYEKTPFTTGNLILSSGLPAMGVEIHASFLKTFLEDSYFQKVPLWVNLLWMILVWVLTMRLVFGRGPGGGLLMAGLVVAGVGAVSYGLWSYQHWWIDCASPMILSLVTYTGVTAQNYLTSEMERKRTRALFGRYVSPAVVEELINHPELVELGGKRQEVTILFSDIRGFTSFSESMPPEKVVGRLNEYLSVMTTAIFKYGGMIDKYMGDGIMAVFGAPVYQPDHAAKAVSAAQEMRRQLVALNQGWESRAEPLFNIGIGLSTGTVVVGNVGSVERTDYTVIGEDVNLASRLESLNKEYGTQLILSDRTLQSLRKNPADIPWEFEELGAVTVRGFSAPIPVYTVHEFQEGEGVPQPPVN